jgi:serine/threonine-protein kinase
MSQLIGTVINNYQLDAVIGEGGMGTVYLATHTFIGRKVAVKVLRRVYSEDPEMVARFMNEARAANAIGHPNIIDIIDVGRLESGDGAGGLPYLMMEHLEGETLAQRLRRVRKLPLLDALAIVKQTTAALGAAHAAGIVHRDLKPENVFVTLDGLGQQRVKVLDFGIAKLRGLAGVNPVETVGGLFGTPIYMSPEQCRGGSVEVDGRADVYAVGTLLYEMLCGEVPFTGPAAGEVLLMQLTQAPRPPRSLNPDIPPGVAAVIERALAKDPADRPQDMETLQRALDEAMIWPPLAATPAPLPGLVPATMTPRPQTEAVEPSVVVSEAALETAEEAPSEATPPSSAAEAAQAPAPGLTDSAAPLPSWVMTPTTLPLPPAAPFATLLARPRRHSAVVLTTLAAAAGLLLFAIGPWSKAAPITPERAPTSPAASSVPVPAAPTPPPPPPPAPPATPAQPPPDATRAATQPARKRAAAARLRRKRAARAPKPTTADPAPSYMGKW